MIKKTIILVAVAILILGCGKNVLNVKVSCWRGPYAYTNIIKDGATFTKKYGGFEETYENAETGKYWLNCYDWDENTSTYVLIEQSSAVEIEDPPLFSTENYDLFYSY